MDSSALRIIVFILLLSGMAMILENYHIIDGYYRLWPVYILFLAYGLLYLFYRKGKNDNFLLSVGVYLLQFSLLAFYCNFTSWKNLGVWWPLFIGFISPPTLLIYIYQKRKFYLLTSITTLMLAIIFILVFQVDSKLWPLSLIFTGTVIYLGITISPHLPISSSGMHANTD